MIGYPIHPIRITCILKLGFIVSELKANQARVRELQRQEFELSLEERRKKMIIKQLRDEVNIDKQQRMIKKKFTKAVREHVSNALMLTGKVLSCSCICVVP
jgi:hypothetical protein